jgi:peptidoglycan/LPS O-acetylase OafA/YrhL
MGILLETKINSRSNNLDFIRFCAATLVMYSHSYALTGVLKEEPLFHFSRGFINFGTFSVLIFFILSGYLIARSYANAASLLQYAIARVVRIYPALFVVVFITVFAFGPIVSVFTLSEYWSETKPYMFLLNVFSLKMFYVLPGVFTGNPINIVNGCLWSLPYELSCYVVVALVGVIRNKNYYMVLGLILLLLLMYFLIGASSWKLIVQYSFYFLCGSMLYWCRSLICINRYVAGAMVVFLIFMLPTHIDNHLKTILLAGTMPYILLAVGYVRSPLNNFGKYGDFSYGMYIIGWFVQQVFVHFFPFYDHNLNFILSFVVTMFFSYLSWHFVEKKSLKLKNRFLKLSPVNVFFVANTKPLMERC